MQLSKLPVVALILIARTCSAKIVIPTPRQEESTSRSVDELVNMVTSCHGDRIHGIVLAGNLPVTLYQTLSVKHSIPIALIENSVNPRTLWMPVMRQFRRKLDVFIIEASSSQVLVATIRKNIRQTIWWNNNASFFILNGSPNCEEFNPDYLLAAWHFNMLNAKLLCYNDESGWIVETYNPFASQAPVPWQQFNVRTAYNGHPFTFFRQKHRENKTICDFDKTKDLAGYPIRVEGLPLGVKETIRSETALSTYQFWTTNERIFRTFAHRLNATLRFSGQERYAEATINADMEKLCRWVLRLGNAEAITYPYDQTGMVLISQFRGYKSQLEKILTVIDVQSRFGMGVVYLITLLFFKFFVCQALVPAILNLVRMTCATGFQNLPDNTAPRIYLATLLFFVVTMQGIFQGDLASLLTTYVPLKNIETAEDVVNYNYKVYGRIQFKYITDNPEFAKRFKAVDDVDINECLQPVLQDSSSVCMEFAQGAALDIAREKDLHISSEYISTFYLAFEFRLDWPLEERINAILSRLVEADALRPWDVQCNPMLLDEFKFDRMVKGNQDFKTMELGELTFAFVILGIGLSCATIVFIIELAMKYKCTIARVRRRIPLHNALQLTLKRARNRRVVP